MPPYRHFVDTVTGATAAAAETMRSPDARWAPALYIEPLTGGLKILTLQGLPEKATRDAVVLQLAKALRAIKVAVVIPMARRAAPATPGAERLFVFALDAERLETWHADVNRSPHRPPTVGPWTRMPLDTKPPDTLIAALTAALR